VGCQAKTLRCSQVQRVRKAGLGAEATFATDVHPGSELLGRSLWLCAMDVATRAFSPGIESAVGQQEQVVAATVWPQRVPLTSLSVPQTRRATPPLRSSLFVVDARQGARPFSAASIGSIPTTTATSCSRAKESSNVSGAATSRRETPKSSPTCTTWRSNRWKRRTGRRHGQSAARRNASVRDKYQSLVSTPSMTPAIARA
jgi:hypothetical protein